MEFLHFKEKSTKQMLQSQKDYYFLNDDLFQTFCRYIFLC